MSELQRHVADVTYIQCLTGILDPVPVTGIIRHFSRSGSGNPVPVICLLTGLFANRTCVKISQIRHVQCAHKIHPIHLINVEEGRGVFSPKKFIQSAIFHHSKILKPIVF